MDRKLARLFIYEVYYRKIMSHKELREMKYGMEVVFNELNKTLILLLIFAILNKLNYFLFSFAILSTIRCFSGGLHFKTNLSCLLFSIVFFTVTSYYSVYLPVELLQYRHLVLMLSAGVIGVISPITSSNRPIKSKRKRRRLKFTAVLFTMFWVYVILFELQDPSIIKCGVITIALQASQLTIGYALDSARNITGAPR
ncbi:MAG TPA: accessory gene regulator B family protein [Candidatus Nitrosocosmicus sp.]|nr:accessory gene regulator B family protein [Candidatus Nitrosocosmicus sp.]